MLSTLVHTAAFTSVVFADYAIETTMTKSEIDSLFRRRAGKTVSSGTAPHMDGCSLLDGFEPFEQQCKGTPLQSVTLPDCAATFDSAACAMETAEERQSTKETLVYDRNSKRDIIDVTAEFEGKVEGVGFGAGVGYFEENYVEQRSITAFKYTGLTLKHREIANSASLELTAKAAEALANDPDEFIRAYGRFYISDIYLGGIFEYSVTLEAAAQLSTRAISAAAELTYKDIFEMTLDANSTLKAIDQSFNRRTGSRVEGGDTDTDVLSSADQNKVNTIYSEWRASMSADTAVPIRMVFKEWFDLPAVTKHLAVENFSKFSPVILPGDAITDQIGNELAKHRSLSKYMDAIEDAMQLRSCYVTSDLTAARNAIQLSASKLPTTEAEVRDFETRIANDETELLGDEYFPAMNGKIEEIINAAVSKCSLQTSLVDGQCGSDTTWDNDNNDDDSVSRWTPWITRAMLNGAPLTMENIQNQAELEQEDSSSSIPYWPNCGAVAAEARGVENGLLTTTHQIVTFSQAGGIECSDVENVGGCMEYQLRLCCTDGYEKDRVRRRADGKKLDEVLCEELNEHIVTTSGNAMARLFLSKGEANMDTLVKIAEELPKFCDGKFKQMMEGESGARLFYRQCKAYTHAAAELAKDGHTELIQAAVVAAMGDETEKQRNCGFLVNTINEHLREGHIEGYHVAEKPSGREVITIDASLQTQFAGLLTAVTTMGGFAAMKLAQVCKSFGQNLAYNAIAA